MCLSRDHEEGHALGHQAGSLEIHINVSLSLLVIQLHGNPLELHKIGNYGVVDTVWVSFRLLWILGEL